jgi:hypothetical protein
MRTTGVAAYDDCRTRRRSDGSTAALLFGRIESAQAFPDILERVRRLERVQRSAVLYRATPEADPGPELVEEIQSAIGP